MTVFFSGPPQPLNVEMKKQLEKTLQGFLEKNQVLKLDVKVKWLLSRGEGGREGERERERERDYIEHNAISLSL